MSFEEYRNASNRTDAANARRKVRSMAKGYDQHKYDGSDPDASDD